jgi:AbiU2
VTITEALPKPDDVAEFKAIGVRTMNVQDNSINKAKAAADALINIAISALDEEANLRLLTTSTGLVNRVNELGISTGLRKLRSIYLRSLILTCATALTDDNKKAASVRNVRLLLKKEDVKNSFKENCAKTLFQPSNLNQPDFADEIKTLNQSRYEKGLTKFDDKLLELKTLETKFSGSELREKVKRLRDRVIAHQELNFDTAGDPRLLSEEETSLKYREIWELVSYLEKAASLSHWLCNGADFDFLGSRDIAKRKAADFWSKLLEIKPSAA